MSARRSLQNTTDHMRKSVQPTIKHNSGFQKCKISHTSNLVAKIFCVVTHELETSADILKIKSLYKYTDPILSSCRYFFVISNKASVCTYVKHTNNFLVKKNKTHHTNNRVRLCLPKTSRTRWRCLTCTCDQGPNLHLNIKHSGWVPRYIGQISKGRHFKYNTKSNATKSKRSSSCTFSLCSKDHISSSFSP